MTANPLTHPRQFHLRRTIILGSSILSAFVFVGIALTFWSEYPGVPASRLLIEATVGPVFMGIYFLWMITLPVMLVLLTIVYWGSHLRRSWLSAAAFVLLGLYWLWLVKLMIDGAFD